MRILIDIGHPAHVHLFKNLANLIIKQGGKVFFTCRESEHESHLLKKYGFEFKSFGPKYNGKIGKLLGMVKFDIQEFWEGIKFKPDILLSHGSIYAAHASLFLKKPHVALEDSGNMEQIRLYLPFSNCVLTPDVLENNLGKKQIKYSGYHELAYLHPNRFKPDENIWKKLEIPSNSEYILIRFSAWKASHDFGKYGFTIREKEELIQSLSKKYKIFISAESKLPIEWQKYILNIDPELLHSVLAKAKLVISEGATIASESGVLGTPAIYVNPLRRWYNEDQEKYGLVYNFRDSNGVLEKAWEILNQANSLEIYKDRRTKLLNEKIDVTNYLYWFLKNFPKSKNSAFVHDRQ